MPLIAGIGPEGPVYIIADHPKAEPTAGVKVSPAAGTTLTDKGLVVARIARLEVIDLQGDVTRHGAVGPGQDVMIGQWNHGSFQPGLLPAGKGRVTEEGDYLVMRGQFFMDTIAGRETFYTLKALISSPWSYGYTIPQATLGAFQGERVRFLEKLLISETSPVLQAAGIGTGTVQLASLDPVQIMVAGWARDNERELQRLQGFTASRRKLVGFGPDGGPVYLRPEGGRK